jgi:uncharacterized protein YukE
MFSVRHTIARFVEGVSGSSQDVTDYQNAIDAVSTSIQRITKGFDTERRRIQATISQHLMKVGSTTMNTWLGTLPQGGGA